MSPHDTRSGAPEQPLQAAGPSPGARIRPLGEALAWGTAALAAAGIEQPRREARLLLDHALAADGDQQVAALSGRLMLAPWAQPVPVAAFEGLVARRARHEPVAHLTGRRGFWTLDLAVSPATLIPRADSETVIEALLAACPDRGRALRLLDLGTGTGCLLLAALSEYPLAWGVGVDRAPAAACLARANAAALGLDRRCAMLCGDWEAALACPPPARRFDVVLSNPPYIPTGDLAGLEAQVGRYEPAMALDGGDDGLAAYRLLLPRIGRLLGSAGCAVFEFGLGQGPALAALAVAHGWRVAGLRADLNGIDRVLIATPG